MVLMVYFQGNTCRGKAVLKDVTGPRKSIPGGVICSGGMTSAGVWEIWYHK